MSFKKIELVEDFFNTKLNKKSIGNSINIKENLGILKKDENGQGAAEYILLFGGVIVIAIAALLIYKSYFGDSTSDLNASRDITSIRNEVRPVP